MLELKFTTKDEADGFSEELTALIEKYNVFGEYRVCSRQREASYGEEIP